MNWSSGLPAASIDDDDEDPDDCEGDEEVGHGDRNVGGGAAAAAEATSPNDSGGVEEEKNGGTGEQRESSGEAAVAATICGSGDDVGNEVASEAAAAADDEGEEEEREQQEPPRRSFSFATELFFLTHRALQVIVSPLDRRRGEMGKRISDIALVRTGLSLSDDGDADGEDEAGRGTAAGFALRIFKEANSAISLAWSVEGFSSDAVTGHACQLALFSASWLELHIGEGNAISSSSNGLRSPSGASLPVAAAEGSASAAAAAATSVSKIAPPLIETICASWVRGASNGRDEQFLSRRAAEDAATFCGKMMERVSGALFHALYKRGSRIYNHELHTDLHFGEFGQPDTDRYHDFVSKQGKL